MNKWLDRYQDGRQVVPISDNTSYRKPIVPISKQEMFNNLVGVPKFYQFNSDPNADAPGRRALSEEYATKYKTKKALKKALKVADVTTDIMQLGNFIPNPYTQIVGEIGNIAGAGIDAFQGGMDVAEGNYGSAGINFTSAFLPAILGNSSFARNSKYLQPKELMYPLSPQAFGSPLRTNYLELINTTRGSTPFKTNVNRALLGTLGAETAIDLNQKENGGLVSKNSLNRNVTCSNCGWSWKLSDGGLDPMTCHKCGGDIKMKEGGELDEYEIKGEYRGQVPTSDVMQNRVPIGMQQIPTDPLTGQPLTREQISRFMPSFNTQQPVISQGTWKGNRTTKDNSFDPYSRIIEQDPQSEANVGKRMRKDFITKKVPAGVTAAAAIMAAPLAAPIVSSAMSAPLTIGSTILPYVTPATLIGAGFGLNGANNLANDLQSGYYLNPKISKSEKIFTGLTTGLDMLGTPGAVEAIGSHLITPAYKGVLGAGKYLTEETALKNMQKLNPFNKIEGISANLQNTNNFNLEELRRVYHNSERFMMPEESRFLHKHGHGKANQYINPDRFDWSVPVRNNNQLSPPPSEIQFMPDGTTRMSYNQQPITDYVSGSYTPDYIDLRRPINGHAPGTSEWNRLNNNLQTWRTVDNTVQTVPKPKIPINKSGLTKDEVLAKTSSKDKDVISKMSETEFENTVLKPNGEIVSYKPGTELDQMTYDLGNRKLKLKDATVLSEKEYADAFNEKLDLLNDIIAKKNKSGVEYKVKGLNENGRLTFHTPEQSIPVKLTDKQKANVEWFNRDPKDFLINKVGLKQEGNKWVYSSDNVSHDEEFDTIDDAIHAIRENLFKPLTEPKTISGESTWGVNINPGQWKGDVEDIANTEYFRSIPGIEMSNTTSGVFADGVARKGTGAYESINEYLKALNLGRVKPGFNSQTEFSRGAWENFINSGRGVGFYANPKTVYGTMKTLAPYTVPTAIGVGALNQKQRGGPIVTNRGQWDYPGQTTIIPSNNITMQGVPYPVVGVDNTGHTKMMHPGMNYTFPGQYVTEYPMAQNGLQIPITNNLFNRTFKDRQLIKQEILDENPALQQVMTLDNMNINYARRNQRKLLEKLHHNPEYFDKDNNQNGVLDNQNDTDDGYPYSGNIYTPEGVVKNPNPGQFTTLINKRGMNRQQIKDAAANDFISHSLHYSPEYQDYSNKLNQMLLTKHSAKMIEENGGVDAYMRSIFTEDPSYSPYKEEMSFIDPSFISEIKSYVKGIPKKQIGGEIPLAQNGKQVKKSSNIVSRENVSGDALTSTLKRELVASFPYLQSLGKSIEKGISYITPDYKSQEDRELLFRRHRPVEYPSISSGLADVVRDYSSRIFNTEMHQPFRDKDGDYEASEEAWRMTLGLPVKSKYIVPSAYRPLNETNKASKYYTLNENMYDKNLLRKKVEELKLKPGQSALINSFAPFINENYMNRDEFSQVDPIQNFQIGVNKKGKMYFYDKYDFDFEPATKVVKPYEYEFYNEFKTGGEMIKRADGSYSKRGLWDNIRDNRGSGKAPTKQMLDQERKIRNQYQVGGQIPTVQGNFKKQNEYGYMVTDEEALAKEAQRLNSKRVLTEGGSLIIFDDNWNIIAADDNPSAPYKQGGSVTLNAGGEQHKIYVKSTNRGEGDKGHIMVNHPTMDKGMWDTIDLTQKAGAKTIAQGVAATKEWHRENPYMKQRGGERNNNLKNINLNLPVIRHQEMNPLHINGFLANDKNQNLFIGGINPRYQNEDFSVGPYMIGVGNKYFQKFPADMGMSGTYHVNDNFDINMGAGQNNINAGIKYNFANGGYVVRRSHDRKGKTHVVTGPDGTKKYFGDPNMGERGNSKYGKEAFYARHKSNLAKNPYFRAYARATWKEGGETMAIGGQTMMNPVTRKDNRNWLEFLKN